MGAQASVSEEDRKTIVVVGVTGAGKSTTCNLITSTRIFVEDCGLSSYTAEAEYCDATRDGLPIRVVDTVGFLSNTDSEEEREAKFAQFADMTPYGVDVFLLTEKYGRWTEANDRHFTLFKELVGADALKRTILLFTHINNRELQQRLKDDLVPAGLRIVSGEVAGVVGVESKRNARAAAADLSKTLRSVVMGLGQDRYSNGAIADAQKRREALQARIDALQSPDQRATLTAQRKGLTSGSSSYEAVLKMVEHAEAIDKDPRRSRKGEGCCRTGPCTQFFGRRGG